MRLTKDGATVENRPADAHISAPVRLRNGEVHRPFCCFTSRPDPPLTNRDLAAREAFAHLSGEQIQQAIDRDEARQLTLRRITAMLETRDLEMVYQPAIRLDEPRIEFVEALARFRSKPYESPDQWIAAAAEVGLGTELEMLAVNLALEGLRSLPETAVLSINVSPQAVISQELAEALSSVPLHRILLEITEHEAVKLYGPLMDALEPLRKHGLRVAVDDVGAGYSSFHHILQMRPDFIKLDMVLTRGIDLDSSRRTLAAALVWFAREIGSNLVAEGVETARELRTLRDLGVKIVQGHLIGRPAPPAEISGHCGPLLTCLQSRGPIRPLGLCMNVSKNKRLGDPFRKHSQAGLQLIDESDAAAKRGPNGDLRTVPSAHLKRTRSTVCGH